MFAEEKGIAFEPAPAAPGDNSPAFRAISPFGQIPTLVDGDQGPAMLAYVNGAIGGRESLVGDALTLADIAIASAFGSALHACAPVDAAAYPDLVRYLDAMLARPAFATRLAAERAFI